jgi:hypothetical protein
MAFLKSNIHHTINANTKKILDSTYNDLSLPKPVAEMQAFLDYSHSPNIVKNINSSSQKLESYCQNMHKKRKHM